jgi:hypothetical protein
LGDHRQECICYERIKIFLNGDCKRGRVQREGQTLNMPPPPQLPPWGRGGVGKGQLSRTTNKNKRDIREIESMSTSFNKNKKSKTGTDEEDDGKDDVKVGGLITKEGIELFEECMVVLNNYYDSRMIELDVYSAATKFFQREIQSQTHPWQVKTFLFLVEEGRLNWLNETFRRGGGGYSYSR